MTARRQILQNPFPSIFDTKSLPWPNPQESIGKKCLSLPNIHCWQVTGPALDIMEKLSLPIMALLDKNHELLEQGESKPRAISFNMWMIGSCPSSAVPTIVFSSRSRRQRTYAKSLLKESKLLDDYPGVRIKTLDKVPAIYQV